ATGNRLEGNRIGTNFLTNPNTGEQTVTATVPNGLDGFLIDNAPNNIIGTGNGARNVISGNGGDGIEVKGQNATGNTIAYNNIGIGLDRANPATDLGNSLAGVRFDGIAAQNPLRENDIKYNGTFGVRDPGTKNKVDGSNSI